MHGGKNGTQVDVIVNVNKWTSVDYGLNFGVKVVTNCRSVKHFKPMVFCKALLVNPTSLS